MPISQLWEKGFVFIELGFLLPILLIPALDCEKQACPVVSFCTGSSIIGAIFNWQL